MRFIVWKMQTWKLSSRTLAIKGGWANKGQSTVVPPPSGMISVKRSMQAIHHGPESWGWNP